MSAFNSLKYNATYNRILEALSMDSELNTTNNLRWPCSICNKNVTSNMKAIQCDTYQKWCHIKCDGISTKVYETLMYASTDWHCLYCTIKFNRDNLAFTLTDDSEINKINNSNSMRFCEFLPSLENITETNKFINFQLHDQNDPDVNLPSLLKTEYYSVSAFQALNNANNLNIFHANVNGLETKFDMLHNFLADSRTSQDIIAISETSEHSDHFLSNVSIDGYSLFHTPSNSRNGGTALYVKNIYNPFERHDLKFQDDLFESVWIEIPNKNSKNILCGTIYRHPNYDMTS